MPTNAISGRVLELTDPAPFPDFAEFELDVQVTMDSTVGYSVRRCDTSDNCGSTCGSACASS